MKNKELTDLLRTISSKAKEEQDKYDYAGYGVITDAKISREQLDEALNIMWDICMNLSKEERDEKYLFGRGLIKSKDIFLSQYKKEGVTIPEEKVNKFRDKLERVKPLVEVLIKLKEVI